MDSPFGLKKLHEISKDIEIEMEQKIFQISREDLAYAYMLVKEFLKAVDLFDTPPENFGEKILLAESYFEIDALEIAKPLLEELISVYNKYTAQAYVILGRIQKKENKSPQIVSSTIMLAIRKAQQEADLQAEAMLWLAYSEILGEFGLSKEARRAFLEAYKLQKELLQRNQEN
ncbi:MAG TPA: hypothetical protein VLG12_08475 [Candidatus Saccharimonadales bacterium]|nr:hypothetical protein [Candidatus Saccharimonadales bacterium]